MVPFVNDLQREPLQDFEKPRLIFKSLSIKIVK